MPFQDSQTPYITTLGYYPGEVKLKSKSRLDHRTDPIYISSADLKAVTQKQRADQVSHALRVENRKELLQLSRCRIENWDNTINGQRRKKLVDREQRFVLEEAERCRIDRQFADEEEARRVSAIQRARQSQYNERDETKELHSKLLLFQTIQERDQQVVLQNSRKYYDTLDDDIYFKNMELYRRECIVKEHLNLQAARDRRGETAAAQLEQIKLKSTAAAKDTNSLSRERLNQINADQEYKIKQAAAKSLQKERARELQQTLLDMKREKEVAVKAQRAHEAEQDDEAKYWRNQKLAQSQMIKRINQARMDNRMNIRDRISDGHRKVFDAKEEKVKKEYERALATSAHRADMQDLAKANARIERKKEMEHYLWLHNEKKLQQENEKKEERTRSLAVEQQLHQNNIEEEGRKRAHKLQTGKELQEYHLLQIQTNTGKRQEISKEMNDYYREKAQQLDSRSMDTRNYMISLKSEAWAQANPRIVKYLDAKLNCVPEARGGLEEFQKTKSRIGLLPAVQCN